MKNEELLEINESLSGEFYFIRHGETDWNKRGILMGQMDIPLNATGESQALVASKILEKYSLGKVFASPLQRAYRTAQVVTNNAGQTIELLNGLKERGFPSGMLHDDLEHITSDNVPESAEKWAEFSLRVLTSLDYILAKNHELPPLIVAHGGVLVAICKALQVEMPTLQNCQPMRFWQNNSGTWNVAALSE
jgi:broad specificity phosphatase PhoE